jgi:hypothetical protein
VEPIGRITLPADARRALDVDASFQAVTRGRTLVLRRGGLGARLPIDQRGSLVLPLWLRRAADLSGSVLAQSPSAVSLEMPSAPRGSQGFRSKAPTGPSFRAAREQGVRI